MDLASQSIPSWGYLIKMFIHQFMRSGMEPYDHWNMDPLRQTPQQQTYEEFDGALNQIIVQLLNSRQFGETKQPIKHEVYLTQFPENY